MGGFLKNFLVAVLFVLSSQETDAHEPLENLEKLPLRWPVTFLDKRHTLGNTMLQYQTFGGYAYFHLGCDLRAAVGAAVRSPVAGELRAGRFDASNYFDADMDSDLYLYVIITGSGGYQYKIGHLDPGSLPRSVRGALKTGRSVKVNQGEVIGHVMEWPKAGLDGSTYNHVHYNISDPAGVDLNPEAVSDPLPDSTPPEIHRVIALFSDGSVRDFNDGHFALPPDEFVLIATDSLDHNVYEHVPPVLRITFENGAKFERDYRKRLAYPDGVRPHMWDVFRAAVRDPNPTSSDRYIYSSGRMWSGRRWGRPLLRLPLPRGAKGRFTIEAGDLAGNTTKLEGVLSGID